MKKLELKQLIKEIIISEDWGGSDQFIMNKSIHKDLGEPEEFPGLYKLENAAESAVDFYWNDYPEYKTRKQDLINDAMHRYFIAYFPETYKRFKEMFS